MKNICLLALFLSSLLYYVLEPVTQYSRKVIEYVSSFIIFFSLIVQLILRPIPYFTEAYTYRCGYGCVHLCVCVYLWNCQSAENCLWRRQIYLSGYLEHSFKIIARWDWDFIASLLYFTALLKWFNYQLLEVIIHAPNLKSTLKKNPQCAINAREKSSPCSLYPLKLFLP